MPGRRIGAAAVLDPLRLPDPAPHPGDGGRRGQYLGLIHVVLVVLEPAHVVVKVDVGIFAELLQIGQHVVRRQIAVVRVGGHGLHGDGLQGLGDGRVDLPGGQRDGVDVLNGHRHGGVPLEGQAAGNHLIEHHAGGVQVGPGVDVAAPGLLRRDVVHRPQGLLGEGAVAPGGHPGDAEVGHLHAAVPQDHDVVGLDVPVDDPPAVGVAQGLDDLGDEVEGLPPVELVPLLLHVLLQGDAVDELHDDVLQVGGAAHIVDGHDVGVGEHGHGLGLLVEAAAQLRVLRQVLPQNLHRHLAVEPVVQGPEDPGHPAHADLLHNLVSVVE